MACLELEYKNQPIKITNGIGSSAVSAEGQSILLEFIQYGRLPQGYSIFWSHNGEEIQTDEAKRIFNEIIEDYLENKGKTLIKRYINMDPETIDSYYANQDWSHSLYDTYLYQNVIGLQHNYWYMKDFGGKAIYGFTKNRPLKISGWQKQQANFIDDTLINSYCELRIFLENKGGNNFVYNTINQLYDKYYSPDESLDIYAKMTKLANNYLQELVLALYIPRSVKQANNSEDLAKLLETPQDLKGLSTKYDSFACVFTGKGDGTNLEAWKLSQLGNELIQIPAAEVKSVYQTFTVHDKTGTYAIINKTWYKVVNSKYLPVNSEISEQLFNTWFGVPNDQQFEVINVYSASNPLNITSKIGDKSLGDGLPVGSYVRAAKGYYTKVSTGEFKNGEEVLSATDTIYQIYFNKKVYEDIANKMEAEYESILANAPRNEKGQLLAPNGKPTKLTDRQYAQVRTKEFIEWFGDWTRIIQNEDGTWIIPDDVSKVIDQETGEPLVVFHHTDNPNLTAFSTDFDNYFSQFKGGTKKAIFFDENSSGTLNRKYDMPIFLNIKNLTTYVGTKEDLHQNGTDYTAVVNESAARDARFGGLHMSRFDDNRMVDQEVWIIHDANNAKSASENVGIFSKENNDLFDSTLMEYIDPNSLKTIHVEEEKTLTLDGQQTKIVLYDLGVNNLSDLWFAFDSENVTEFLPSNSDKGIETTINGVKKRIHYKIGLKNVTQTLENIRRISLGIQYYKTLINDVMPDEIKENIREVFEYIVSKNGAFVQGLNLSEEAMAFISSFWTAENEGISEVNPNLWGDILDENTKELAKAYYQLSDDTVSDKIQEDNGKVVCSIM